MYVIMLAVPCDADHDEGKQLGIGEVVLDLKQRVKCRQSSPMKSLAMFIHTHQCCPLDTVAVDEAEKKETDSGQNSHLHTPRYKPPGYFGILDFGENYQELLTASSGGSHSGKNGFVR